MGKRFSALLALFCAAGLSSPASAQPPGGRPATKSTEPTSQDKSNSSIVKGMMAFDKNGDGKLTRDEVTDERLFRLFDRADANKDGVVTLEELTALAAVMEAEMGQGGGRGGPDGDFGGPPGGGPGGRGPGGPGGPPGGRGRRGPGGPGGGDGPPDGGFGRPGPGGDASVPGMRGPGGFGGPPQPGQIMPIFMQERLSLTAAQKSKLQDLQKEVDGKMAKILTSEQKKQLVEMRAEFGPPGRGGRGRGGPPGGGPGGPGGPPGGGPGGGGPPNGRPDDPSSR